MTDLTSTQVVAETLQGTSRNCFNCSKDLSPLENPSKKGVNKLVEMRAQSPPKKAGNSSVLDAAEAQYQAWQTNHPSALDNFSQFSAQADRKQVAVFLDYDGTLSPIVEDPDRAYMSDAMRAAVKAIAAHFPTAIISGRGREKVYEFVQLGELYYAGSHGMDIMGPVNRSNVPLANGVGIVDANGNKMAHFQPASEYTPIINEVFDRLKEAASEVEGALVEHNKFCITVHFRRVQEEFWETLATIVSNIVKDYSKLRTMHGRKVLEIRPTVDWDKGKALSYLMKQLGMDNAEDVLPVYVGDDRTDEDAFTVLKERGVGAGILVSSVAKKTAASYSLRDPSEVMDFLLKLVKWRATQLSETADDVA